MTPSFSAGTLFRGSSRRTLSCSPWWVRRGAIYIFPDSGQHLSIPFFKVFSHTPPNSLNSLTFHDEFYSETFYNNHRMLKICLLIHDFSTQYYLKICSESLNLTDSIWTLCPLIFKLTPRYGPHGFCQLRGGGGNGSMQMKRLRSHFTPYFPSSLFLYAVFMSLHGSLMLIPPCPAYSHRQAL